MAGGQPELRPFAAELCRSGALWGLQRAHGWLVLADADGHERLALWTSRSGAAIWARALAAPGAPAWEPAPLLIDELVARWLPGLHEDGTGLVLDHGGPERPGQPASPAALLQLLARTTEVVRGR